MNLNPKDFRKLPEDFPLKISAMAQSPLILIKTSGDVTYGGKYKDSVVEKYDESAGDVLLFAWAGQWRTDVFLLSQKDIDKHYR